MEPFPLSPALLCLITLLAIVWNWQHNQRKGKLSPIPSWVPSPPNFPLLGHLPYVLYFRRAAPQGLQMCIEWYGGVCKFNLFRPSNHCLLINKPDLIKKLLSSSEHVQKPAFIYHEVVVQTPLKDGLAVADVVPWKVHRPHMSGALKFSSLKSYLPIFAQHASLLVQAIYGLDTLKRDCEAGTFTHLLEVPLTELMHVHTIKAISHIVMGKINKAPEFQTSCSQFYKDIERFKEITGEILFKPYIRMKGIWWMHPCKAEMNQITGRIEKYCYDILHEYRKSTSLKADSENLYQSDESADESGLNLRESEKGSQFRSIMEHLVGSGLTDYEILAETYTIFIAGSETSSGTMRFLMYQLAMNQHHQAQCQREVDQVFEDASGHIGPNDLQRLKYLERCIKETLRLYPALPFFARQLLTPLKLEENLEIGPGVTVFVCPWALHRDPKYYHEPEKFQPDRFLPENSKDRSSYCYIPFSAGPRDCLGWRFAMAQMTITAAWILRHFQINVDDRAAKVNVLYSGALITEPAINFAVKQRNFR